MASTIARVVELSATSDTSFADAVDAGMARARSTLRNVTAGWVKDQRVRADGDTLTYQVNLEVTFILEDDADLT